jgi:hypothetical protein
MGEPAAKIKADDIAAVFREEIRADVESLKAKGIHPTLVGFLGTGDVSAKKYSEWTMKACEADGIRFEVREVSGACGPRAVPPALRRRASECAPHVANALGGDEARRRADPARWLSSETRSRAQVYSRTALQDMLAPVGLLTVPRCAGRQE